jgi:hypothetical protein
MVCYAVNLNSFSLSPDALSYSRRKPLESAFLNRCSDLGRQKEKPIPRHLQSPSGFPSPALELVGRIRQILESRNLNLADAHRESVSSFPDRHELRVPLSLYQNLRAEIPVFPDIFQMSALSTVTRYRLLDWLAVFGLPVHRIPEMQLLLPASRTIVLDQTTSGLSEISLAWEEIGFPTADLLPLSSMLRIDRRISSGLGPAPNAFLYARIGLQDAFAFPELVPRSVVRIDPRQPEQFLPARRAETSRAFFLLEHEGGFLCCRVRRVDNARILPHTAEIPYAQIPLTIGGDCSLRGVVDLEVRPLNRAEQPKVPRESARSQASKSLDSVGPTLGKQIQIARRKSGLRLREASLRSAAIAEKLQDPRFFISTASLSGYETSHAIPRDVHKLLSLCILYSLDFPTLFASAGATPGSPEQEPIPGPLLQRERYQLSREVSHLALRPKGVLQDILSRVVEIPYFLGNSLNELTGLPAFSLRDTFWVAADRPSFHPHLQGALFIVVNRRIKFPPRNTQGSTTLQPLFVLVRRDGTYYCGRCTLENDHIVLHPFANGISQPIRIRNRVDAEVVGQVVTVVRQIARPSSTR